jgi:hypothetical protein
VIGVAPLLLFFGYPETYAPVITGLAVVALAVVAWDGRLLRWLLLGWTIGLAAAVAHHLAAFCLVPLALATVLHIWHARRWTLRAIGALGLGLSGLVLVGWVVHSRASLLLPFAPDAPTTCLGKGICQMLSTDYS